MADVGDVPAVGEELAPDGERSQRTGSVNVDDCFGILGFGMSVQILDAGHEVQGGVADGPGVAGALALAVELVGGLFTNTPMFAGVGRAPVRDVAGLEDDVILAADLLVLPIRRQLVVAVDGDVSHAPDEPVGAVDAAAKQIIGACRNVEHSCGLHRFIVNCQNSLQNKQVNQDPKSNEE